MHIGFMTPSFSTLEQNGQTFDLLTDHANGLRIMISRLGAELVSLAKDEGGSWHGFLYRDAITSPAESGWNNHATVMGFFIHRIKGGRAIYREREIRGGTHSFLRHKVFAAPEFDEARCSLTYHLSPSQIAPEEYPDKVVFSLTYQLEDGALRVRFRFENLEQDEAYLSFGLHPGFAVDSMEAAQVILPSGNYVRHLAPDNFLSGESIGFEHSAGPMPFSKQELPGAIILELKDVPLPIFELHSGHGRVALGVEEAPFITLWSDGSPFVCIEPCWGLPDHHEQRPFEEKAGIEKIPAGGILEKQFTIKPSPVGGL